MDVLYLTYEVRYEGTQQSFPFCLRLGAVVPGSRLSATLLSVKFSVSVLPTYSKLWCLGIQVVITQWTYGLIVSYSAEGKIPAFVRVQLRLGSFDAHYSELSCIEPPNGTLSNSSF